MKKLMVYGLTAAVLCAMLGSCGSEAKTEEEKIEAAMEQLDSMSEKEVEKAFEKAEEEYEKEKEGSETEIENTEEPEELEEPEEPEAVEETYEKLPEIGSAAINSGLIQIGDDIFRIGGYCTVNDFIAQYGDKYDLSGINTDGYLTYGEQDSFEAKKNDSDITITLKYVFYPVFKDPVYKGYTLSEVFEDYELTEEFLDQKGKVGEAYIYDVSPSSDMAREFTWYPILGGATANDVLEVKYDEIEPYLQSLGFTPTDENKTPEENIGTYYIHESTLQSPVKDYPDSYVYTIRLDEENLFANVAVVTSEWFYIMKENKTTGFNMYSDIEFYMPEVLK